MNNAVFSTALTTESAIYTASYALLEKYFNLFVIHIHFQLKHHYCPNPDLVHGVLIQPD